MITRECGDGFYLVLVDSRLNPGTKAWRVMRVEEVKSEPEEEYGRVSD